MNVPDLHRISLGAYVLGALEAAERADLEAHLAACPSCQEEVVRLAGLPGMLRQLTLDEVTGDGAEPAPPAAEVWGALAERALTSASSSGRGSGQNFGRGSRRPSSAGTDRRAAGPRRVLLAAAAAVVLAVLVTGSFATGLIGDGWRSGTTVTATDATTHVHAAVRMHQREAGTELVLTLSGVPRKQRCMLVAVGRDGQRETAATWLAGYSGEAELEGYTSISQNALAALEIVTPDGRPLLRLPV